MCQWVAREDYVFKPGERVLVTLQYPDWPAAEVRAAQFFPGMTPPFLVDVYGWQSETNIEWVMALPAAPVPMGS